jgi:hypothetical protein
VGPRDAADAHHFRVDLETALGAAVVAGGAEVEPAGGAKGGGGGDGGRWGEVSCMCRRPRIRVVALRSEPGVTDTALKTERVQFPFSFWRIKSARAARRTSPSSLRPWIFWRCAG